MKTKLYLMIAIFVLAANSYGKKSSPWSKLSWMIGEWKGLGSGEPGKSNGIFTFKPDLGSKILVRKAHSDYPATADRPAFVHDDLLIVYLDVSGNPSKAIYFDNEGHTITYSINYADKNIVFLSDKIPNVPVFRLTYTQIDGETVNVKFEMSQDGEKFITYVEGKCRKTK